MAKLGMLKLKGASGKGYKFHVFPAGTTFKSSIECVYYVSKREMTPDDLGSHTDIYIGETDDYNGRHGKQHKNHHKYDCFVKNGFNAISVRKTNGQIERTTIEKDLIDALDPPCNI